MFGQIAPTEFDLRFSLFGIPVRVHPGFWLVGAFMGWSPGWANALDVNMAVLLIAWLICIFFSILIHELGHAVTARAFGWPPHVVLYHFGGLAMYQPTRGHTPSRSILISFAGPCAGFMLYGVVFAVNEWLIRTKTIPPPIVQYGIIQLKWVNLWWGLINLLPVLPLDGGRIGESVCHALRVRDADGWILKISMVVAGGVALYLLYLHKQNVVSLYPGILFGFLCFNNFQMYQAYKNRGYW